MKRLIDSGRERGHLMAMIERGGEARHKRSEDERAADIIDVESAREEQRGSEAAEAEGDAAEIYRGSGVAFIGGEDRLESRVVQHAGPETEQQKTGDAQQPF